MNIIEILLKFFEVIYRAVNSKSPASALFSGLEPLVTDLIHDIQFRSLRYRAYNELKGRRKVEIMPAHNLAKFIKLFYSKKVRERVFDPMLADVYEEYISSLDQGGSKLELTIIRLRANANLLLAAFIQPLESVVKKIKELWKLG